MKLRHLAAVAAIGIQAAVAQIAGAHAADLRIGFTADPVTLDPGNYRSRDTEAVLRSMYSGLVALDAHMNPVPELAESWKRVDPRTYDFTLRQGVKFHSGAVLSADDVVFTFTRILTDDALNGQSSPRRGLLGPLKSVQKLDDRTVRFVLAEPWPALPTMLSFIEIVSKSFGEKVGTPGLATQEDGTGPFRLLSWRRGEQLAMARFPDYFGGSPAIPPLAKACVERVIVKFIPENASRVAALLAGDVDLINELPVFDVKQVEANPNTLVASVQGTRTMFVALNDLKPPFNDVRVRQAANFALNRRVIVDRILAGRATLVNGVLSPAAFAFDPDLPAYDYDPVKAKALLAAAGHPNGIDVTLDVDGANKDTAEAIGSLLTQSGIRTKVAVGDMAQLRQRYAPDSKRDGDMFLIGWGNASLDPFDIFTPTLHTGGRGNFAGYSNPEVDKLLDAADVQTDRAHRAGLYKQAQVIVNKDAPWIFLWVPQDIYGASKRLSGWAPSADGWLNLGDTCIQ